MNKFIFLLAALGVACETNPQYQTPDERCCECLAENESVVSETGYYLEDGGVHVEEEVEKCMPNELVCLADIRTDNEITQTAECLLVHCREECEHLRIIGPAGEDVR